MQGFETTWLDNYSDQQHFLLLDALDEYDAGTISVEALIDRLENVLDIWSLAPEHWSDPLLLDIAELINRYSGARYQVASNVSLEDRARISEALDRLRARLVPLCRWRVIQRIGSVIDSYERGNSHLGTLARSLIGLHWDLEDHRVFPKGERWFGEEWYSDFRGTVYDIDYLHDMLVVEDKSYKKRLAKSIADDLAELKNLLKSAEKSLLQKDDAAR